MLIDLKNRIIVVCLAILGVIAGLLKFRADAKQEGRDEAEEEFQSNDTTQADRIRKEVGWSERKVADMSDADIVDGLRKDGGLRAGDSERDNQIVG